MTPEQISARLQPFTLLPVSEWEMRVCKGDASHLVGIGVYARPQSDGSCLRYWFKWPWDCLPNNLIGAADMERCGVLDAFVAYLERQDAE